MRRLLKISIYFFVATVLLLALNLFDILNLSDALYRICGAVCVVSLFFLVYSRVWLISYRRKAPKSNKK